MIPPAEPLRPRDFALLLLASGDLRPRQRARDQQADIAGLELKRRLLDRLVALDPEPGEMDAALGRVIEEMGVPAGPVRAIALGIREEWQALAQSPEGIQFLLAQGLNQFPTSQERPGCAESFS